MKPTTILAVLVLLAIGFGTGIAFMWAMVETTRPLENPQFPAEAGMTNSEDPVTTVMYVEHRDVAAMQRLGWRVTDRLAGTNHGRYSVLMVWEGEGEPVWVVTQLVSRTISVDGKRI